MVESCQSDSVSQGFRVCAVSSERSGRVWVSASEPVSESSSVKPGGPKHGITSFRKTSVGMVRERIPRARGPANSAQGVESFVKLLKSLYNSKTNRGAVKQKKGGKAGTYVRCSLSEDVWRIVLRTYGWHHVYYGLAPHGRTRRARRL